MSKQSGLGDNLYVDGYDISGDVNSLEKIGGGHGVWDSTGIDKYANERLGTVRDGEISWAGFFNDATSQEHDALKTLPTTDRHLMYCRGTTLGNPAACMVAKQLNYDWTRGNDGSLSSKLTAQSNGYGLDWGKLLTAGKRTDTSATNGTSVDYSAAGTNGAQAFLQVFSFTGTSVTVKVQSSSDNGVGDAFADVAGLTFTAATGRTVQRLAVTGAIERYLRIATTGTFSSAVFAVSVNVNEIATVF